MLYRRITLWFLPLLILLILATLMLFAQLSHGAHAAGVKHQQKHYISAPAKATPKQTDGGMTPDSYWRY